MERGKRNGLVLFVFVEIFFGVTSAFGAIGQVSDAAWWESILYDQSSLSYVTPHPTWCVAGSYYNDGPSGTVARGIYIFNNPAVIRDGDPNYVVISATLYLNLDYGWCSWSDYNMPGVRAYQAEIADHNSTSVIATGDFFAPVLKDLGYIVPPTGVLSVTPPAQGEYALDITEAMRAAVAHPEWGYNFAVRLQLGNETTGNIVDENLRVEYVFRGPAQVSPGPRIEVTLYDPNQPANCSEVKLAGHVYLGDLNGDCRINFKDFAIIAGQWLLCNDPAKFGTDPTCVRNW